MEVPYTLGAFISWSEIETILARGPLELRDVWPLKRRLVFLPLRPPCYSGRSRHRPTSMRFDHVPRFLFPVLAFGIAVYLMSTDHFNWHELPIRQLRIHGVHNVVAPAKTSSIPLPAKRIIGTIDTVGPDGGITADRRNWVELSGWAASTAPGVRVDTVVVRVDGQPVATEQEFFARLDVSAAYNRPDLPVSGWTIPIKLKAMKPGNHTLSAEAITSDHESAVVSSVKLKIMGSQ